jgi:hypothetical protein
MHIFAAVVLQECSAQRQQACQASSGPHKTRSQSSSERKLGENRQIRNDSPGEEKKKSAEKNFAAKEGGLEVGGKLLLLSTGSAEIRTLDVQP